MKSGRSQVGILVVAILVVAAMLACGSGGLLSRSEPTATRAPRPIFTVTLTPTNTPLLTNTPPPTDTGTPTPSQIPVETASPMPLPTNTPPPTAGPTDQPPPTAIHTQVPQASNTPEPQFAWTGEVTDTFDNCTGTRVFGFVLDRNGDLAGDVWVHWWSDGWLGSWGTSLWTELGPAPPWKGDGGNWDGLIDDNRVRQNTWHVCLVPEEGSWDCISNTVDTTTNLDCTPGTGIQEVQITFRQN
jgi:hypothetical protein